MFTCNSCFPITPLEIDPDSDVDEEGDQLLGELYQMLRKFSDTPSRLFMVVRPLVVQQRRHVQAIAHFMHFGHLSVGDGSPRMILLSKNSNEISARFKQRYKQARNAQSQSKPATNEMPLRKHRTDGHLTPSAWDYRDEQYRGSAAYYSSADDSASLSSQFSYASGVSDMTNPIRRRVKRQRNPAAFACDYAGCGDRFDRFCDLNHHSRIHLPYLQRPYPCEKCDKRFLFPPKDLKRHEATHAPDGVESSPPTATIAHAEASSMPEKHFAQMVSVFDHDLDNDIQSSI